MTDKYTAFCTNRFLNCGGKLLDINTSKVMGILNLTPDSFYDGGKHNTLSAALAQTEQMLEDEADIIDIGGMSTKPGAELLTIDEELQRVIPAVEAISDKFPDAILSVDTIYARVAEEAIAAGAHIINDISAGSIDPHLIPTVAKLQVPYILMHMQGTPRNMQQNPHYNNVVDEVLHFIIEKVNHLRSLGLNDIVIDPGFGFGKTVEHNYQLLAGLDRFHMLDVPLLVGVSRKSMICRPLGVPPAKALNGTTVVNSIALSKGPAILRVHDVKEAVELIKIWEVMQASTSL